MGILEVEAENQDLQRKLQEKEELEREQQEKIETLTRMICVSSAGTADVKKVR